MANDMTPDRSQRFFELTRFLEGRTLVWGLFEDRFGRVRTRFTVEMNGRWQDRRFILDERFVYDSGDTEDRTWTIYPGEPGAFTATCDDCIGNAVGRCGTDSVRMTYRFRLKMKDKSFVVDFDDRLYRMSDDTAVNRATMKKWGVKLGELSLFFQRQPSTKLAERADAYRT